MTEVTRMELFHYAVGNMERHALEVTRLHIADDSVARAYVEQVRRGILGETENQIAWDQIDDLGPLADKARKFLSDEGDEAEMNRIANALRNNDGLLTLNSIVEVFEAVQEIADDVIEDFYSKHPALDYLRRLREEKRDKS